MLTFQKIILILQNYWDKNSCILLQPYDIEIGAGTSHTATFLRSIGPEPWRAAYVQSSRRPQDGRYGNNPNRLQHYYQYQVVLKPAPIEILNMYLNSLQILGINSSENDIRFIEDNWENPTLGAWGIGWEVCLNGMEISQLTYLQQMGGLDCSPITGEITYGLERLAMYLQGVESIYDLIWSEDSNGRYISYGDIFRQNEIEQSIYNFECASPNMLLTHFNDYENEVKRLINFSLVLPAYEAMLKTAHVFNLLDSVGAISITERAAYIGRIRNLSRSIANSYYDSRKQLGFPMLNNHRNFKVN